MTGMKKRGIYAWDFSKKYPMTFVVNANDVFILFGKRNRFRVLSRN